MSIYIKGVSIPQKGDLHVVITSSGFVKDKHGFALEAVAIPVPEHGRLIDEQWLKDAMITTLEALKKNPKMDKQEMHLIAAFDTLRVMVEDAPTIIPASEEVEG